MIRNEKSSLEKLKNECSLLKSNSTNEKILENVFDEIGNGLCRLNLKSLEHYDIKLTTINKFFLATANSICGSIKSFEEKLEVLIQCCEDGELPYSVEELKGYLNDYKDKNYPPVSHSETYRSAYNPAYRIVKSEYKDYFGMFCKIDYLMKSEHRVNVAIDGNSGSGKSTLASLIGDIYDCNIFHMDHFFLTPELRTEERLKEVGGNVDYARFNQEVIFGLKNEHSFEYRRYDCREMIFGQPICVIPKKLNIIEGSYSMHPTLTNNYNLKIFLHIDEETQYQRILKRNGVSMLKRFVDEWLPLENEYFKEFKIKEHSDLIFSKKNIDYKGQ